MKHRRWMVGTLAGLLLLCLVPGFMTYRAWRQEGLNRRLITAIEKRDTSAALAALDARADPNARRTPDGGLSFWQRLWERLRGRKPPGTGPTALLLACGATETGSCDIRVIEALLQRGADPNARNAKDETALGWAMLDSNRAAVRALVRRGADLRRLSPTGWTPMDFAAARNDVALAEALLARGEDVNGRDWTGWTPLHWAALGNADMIRWLLDRHADIHARGYRGNTALMRAAGEGCLPAVRLLLARGADVNARNDYGQPALIWTCQYLAPAHIVAELLRHGAEVNARDRRGKTALWWARSVNARVKTLKLLQRAGARE